MKKSFLLLAVALVMGVSAFAQSINFGPKIGYQTAELSYDKANIKAGFQDHFTAGAFVRLGFEKLYVQPEVLWFKDGHVFSMTANNEGQGILPEEHVNITWNLMNIQVPVLIGYELIDLNVATIRVQAGPTANFNIGDKPIFDKTFSFTPQEGEDPITVNEGDQAFDTHGIAWGIQAGIGFDVLKKITLDINYNWGISKMIGSRLINTTKLGEYFDFSNIDHAQQNLLIHDRLPPFPQVLRPWSFPSHGRRSGREGRAG